MTVADARFAKPIDAGLMAQLAAEHDLLVTVEEGVLAGGFGSAVWETLNEAGATPPRILRVGLPDRYVTHGKPALLHEEVGFTGRAHRRARRRGDLRPRVGDRRRLAAARRRASAGRRGRCADAARRPSRLNETARRGSGPFRGRRDDAVLRERSMMLRSRRDAVTCSQVTA